MTDELIEANLLVTVFGGSGFLGRHVVRALARRGWRVRVAVRRPDLAFHLQPLGDVGQIHAVQANLRYPDFVAHALRDAAAAVNLVGILQEQGAQRFDAIQHLGAQTVAKAVQEAGLDIFVHMSAIGADPAGSSLYARTKAFGEAAVRQILPGAIIMRPSVVFGPEDQFFNRFAAMARFMPALPLIGGGQTKLQPVFAGDVATAVALAVEDKATPGTTYELGGPEVATLRQINEFVLKVTGRRRWLVPVSFERAKLARLRHRSRNETVAWPFSRNVQDNQGSGRAVAPRQSRLGASGGRRADFPWPWHRARTVRDLGAFLSLPLPQNRAICGHPRVLRRGSRLA